LPVTAVPRVFVYGTLRRGECNHHYLGGAVWLGRQRTAARYRLVKLRWYPAALAGGHTALHGEVYAVSRARLAQLDRLEDCPREYRRQRIATAYGPAWIYLYHAPLPAEARVIRNGDWCNPRRPRPCAPVPRRTVAREGTAPLPFRRGR
jgi:gamma-glutamylcyclotransferase (GGCT)/AIG2-like uncharacterized protein YtfP